MNKEPRSMSSSSSSNTFRGSAMRALREPFHVGNPQPTADELKLTNQRRFEGALLRNLLSFLLPALYSLLSKCWVSQFDTSSVATVDSYVYIGVIAEVVNEGLPRAAWLIIGDYASRSLHSRIALSQTLIAFQAAVGFLVSLIIICAARSFTSAFVPAEVRQASLTYVRLGAFQTFSSAIEYATANATRALDQPNIPLVISLARFAINIVLDMLFISPFHVGTYTPTINSQGALRLACDLTAAFCGLAYFLWIVGKLRKTDLVEHTIKPTLKAFLVLLKPGIITLAESAIRNIIYLWLVANIVQMGSDYATAWGVFTTIRWGLIMVPVQSLEASSLAFVGHHWGAFRCATMYSKRPKASRQQLKGIVRPAFIACMVALAIEIPLCLIFSFVGVEPYARWISGSDRVSKITKHMWRTIDWCYIFYALSTQLATILLATVPRWYLYQSLVSNIFFMLPWAIVCQVMKLNAANAWTYHSLVFGGSLVFSFFDILIVLTLWALKLSKGRMTIGELHSAH